MWSVEESLNQQEFPLQVCDFNSNQFMVKRLRSNAEVEFCLVLSGNCEVVIDGTKHLCEKNSVILLCRGDQDFRTIGGKCSMKSISLTFDPSLVDDRTTARSVLRSLDHINHLNLSDEETATANLLFRNITEECTYKRSNWKRVALNHIETLLIILKRAADRNVPNLENHDSTIMEIVSYLDEKYMEKLSLVKVSDRFGFSPYTLSKKFKQHTGLGFKEYLIHRCITEARRLLEETDNKVAAIAYEVGFGSLSSFNDDFRRLTGVTPSAYRRIALGNSACNKRRPGQTSHRHRNMTYSGVSK